MIAAAAAAAVVDDVIGLDWVQGEVLMAPPYALWSANVPVSKLFLLFYLDEVVL